MNSIVRNKKLIVILLVGAIIILVTVLFILQPTKDETIENVKIEIFNTFKERNDLFRSAAIFAQAQGGKILKVSKPHKATSGLKAHTTDPYMVLELDKESDAYKNMHTLIYEYNFNEIYKFRVLIYFNKTSSYDIEQGIVFSPSGVKPKNMYTEPLEDNWYYYSVRLE